MKAIEIKGLNKMNGMLSSLPSELMDAISKECYSFMMSVKKSAKLRAPKNTGELRKSIKLNNKSKNKWVLTVESPYGVYQEEGFKPHAVHMSMIAGNNGNGFAWVKKNTPFIKPAIEHNLNKFTQNLSDATYRATKNSKK